MILKAFCKNVSQVLAIIWQQSHSFFDAEAVVLDDNQNKKLQQRFGSSGIPSRVNFTDIDLN